MTERFAGAGRWVAVLAIVLLVAGGFGAVAVAAGGPPTRPLSAQFVEAPGLFIGNDVDVLGINVGQVTGIHPGPGYVTVDMRIRKSIKLPAAVTAILMAPEVVSDRFVELGPAYTGGPTLGAGAVIPANRTGIPASVDQVYYQLDQLARQLGPEGANKNGAVSALVHQLAVNLGPNGADFHDAVVKFSQGLDALSANSPALAGTLTNLGELTQALATHSSDYQAFASDLAAVSQILVQDRQDISATLASLQTLFANLTSFINADGAALGSSITNLRAFAAALSSQQAALAQAYDLAPLSLQNLDNAINKTAPGGPAVVGRDDPVASTPGLFNQVCGSAALRFLVLLASGTQTNPLTHATSTDTLCGIGNALVALSPPPGAPSGPNLTLTALVP
ncbi:MAG TPA: MCE family protein [Acidimicrobiales bacterium]|nr:MCE family protein [Acidimicrobiales bacterium]